MIFEYSGLKTATERYGKVESIIERSYNCEWDDEIHESFRKFVVGCEGDARSLKSINNQVERTCQELNSSHIEQEKNFAKKINRDAIDLCQTARSLL